MPLISVIIPVYNAERTIQETVKSVLKQSFSDFELIAINDGSTDSTLDILSQITDQRIKVYSYPNAGPNHSRNRGLSHASGKYVSFIDADDLWTADKLEAQLRAIEQNPEAAVAYSWTNCIDESGNFLRRGGYFSWSGDVYARLLLNDFIESGSNPLILKQAITEVGNFDESMPAAQDWDMWLRLAERYHFVVVPSIQILYRVASNSWSSNVLRMEAASLRVIERCYAKAPESIQHLKQISLANRYKYLTFKALEGFPEQQKGFIAAKYLWQAIRYDSNLLKRKVIWKILLKISIIILLPSQQAQILFNKYAKLFNTITLLGYLQVEPILI